MAEELIRALRLETFLERLLGREGRMQRDGVVVGSLLGQQLCRRRLGRRDAQGVKLGG